MRRQLVHTGWALAIGTLTLALTGAAGSIAAARPVTAPTTTTTTPTTSTAATTTTSVPAGAPISEDAIRDAKVGWSRFVADNFATPNAVLDACPLLTSEAATASVSGLGLVPTDLPYGVSLYRDATGVGIIGIVCGNDLAKAASPAGATLFTVEVTLLDGQAVFPQYVVRIAGNNTPIAASPELGGDIITRCRNDRQFCVASWHSDGLIVTVKLEGPRTEQSEAQVRQLLVSLAPQVVANLATVSTTP